MRILLVVLFSLSISSCFSQINSTYRFGHKPFGEMHQNIQKWDDGYLVHSIQFGNPWEQNHLRMVDSNNVVEWMYEMDSNYARYFNTVVTNEHKVFCFGSPRHTGTTYPVDVFLTIIDSSFNIQLEKQITFPFNITLCQFFPAKDGGVIGIVNEICNYSRIMRIDRNGNILWFQGYQPITSPPSGFGRSRVMSIHYMNNNKYMVVGYLGFGGEQMNFTVDDNGNYIDSKYFEMVPDEDVPRVTTFNGTTFASWVQRRFSGESSVLLEMDTAFQLVSAHAMEFGDSSQYPTNIHYSGGDILLTGGLNFYPDHIGALFSIDKTSWTSNWGIETTVDGTGHLGYEFFHSLLNSNDEFVIASNYGPMDLSHNGGNNFNHWSLTNIDLMNGAGFCDGIMSPLTLTSITPNMIDYGMYMWGPTSWTEQLVTGSPIPHIPGQAELMCDNSDVGVISSISDERSDELIDVYPNPAKDLLNVQLNTSGTYQLCLFSTSGHLVQSTTIFNSDFHQMDVSILADGMYLLTITSDRTMIQRKIVVR